MKELLFNQAYFSQIVALAVVLLLLVLLVVFGIRHGKRTHTQRKLALMGVDVIADAQLVDAVGDDMLVDFLILRPEKVIAVTVLPYEGIVFAAEQIEQWTQVLKSGSFKFVNPYQNFASQKNAVLRALPNAKVECKVFFPHASFPKDKPDAILLMSDLPNKREYRLSDMREVSSIVADEWKTLKGHTH